MNLQRPPNKHSWPFVTSLTTLVYRVRVSSPVSGPVHQPSRPHYWLNNQPSKISFRFSSSRERLSRASHIHNAHIHKCSHTHPYIYTHTQCYNRSCGRASRAWSRNTCPLWELTSDLIKSFKWSSVVVYSVHTHTDADSDTLCSLQRHWERSVGGRLWLSQTHWDYLMKPGRNVRIKSEIIFSIKI